MKGIKVAKQLLTLTIALMIFASFAFPQGGGKAKPQRIKIPRGRSEISLIGSLSNGQEMEYVFQAAAGQTATIKVSNSGLFDYRIFNADADFETEFDSSRSAAYELPASGDYFLFVRKKMVNRPRTARFVLVLSVK